MSHKIKMSGVRLIVVTSVGDGTMVTARYKSGKTRVITFAQDELGLGDLMVSARKAGVEIKGLCDICNAAFPTQSILTGDEFLAVCDSCYADLYQPDPSIEQPATGPDEPAFPIPTGNALAEILRLTPEQAQHLTGATRLNFWWNGSLHVQIQHGNRAIKLDCPQAVITQPKLAEFFAGWGWQQIEGKPYFKPTPASLVQL